MIAGLGIDVCEIARIEKAMERPRFALRAFTEGERARIDQRGAKTAAGLFAVKEAVAKALGSGLTVSAFRTWKSFGRSRAAPLPPDRRALKRLEALGGGSVFVSITHDAGVAAAVAVVEASLAINGRWSTPNSQEQFGRGFV
jgi:holo-[acyl-carrier-protein] synthase